MADHRRGRTRHQWTRDSRKNRARMSTSSRRRTTRPRWWSSVRSQDAEPALLARIRATVEALDPNVPLVRTNMLRDQTRSALSISLDGGRHAVGVRHDRDAADRDRDLRADPQCRPSEHTRDRNPYRPRGGRRDVLGRFLGRGLRLGAAGVVCGACAALLIARILGAVLYGVSPTDVVSFSAALALVITIVPVASLIPAWRASRTIRSRRYATDKTRPYEVPIANRFRSVRMYQRPSTSAGDASVASPILFTCSSSNVGPAFSTNVSPSSLVKKTLPSTATGEAEKPFALRDAEPALPQHFPVVASNA